MELYVSVIYKKNRESRRASLWFYMAIFEETRRQLLQLSRLGTTLHDTHTHTHRKTNWHMPLLPLHLPLCLFSCPCIAFLSCLAFKIIQKITIYMSERRAHERALRQNRQAVGGAAGNAGGTGGGGTGGGSQSTRQFQLQLRTSTDTQ